MTDDFDPLRLPDDQPEVVEGELMDARGGNAVWTAEKARVVLTMVSADGSVTKAAAAVGVHVQTVYRAIKRDSEFRKAYRQAQEFASVSLMSRAHERAFDPVDPADQVLIALLKFRADRVHRVLDGDAFEDEPENTAMGLDPRIVGLMESADRAILLGALTKYITLQQEADLNARALPQPRR